MLDFLFIGMGFLTTFRHFLTGLYKSRQVVWRLTKRDYKNAYLGSFLGVLWTIIQPIVMIFVLWLIFTIGFRVNRDVNGVPFIAYLTLGMMAWNFFSNAFLSSANVFDQYSYLVQKLSFRVSLLPIVKILSATLTHLVFIGVSTFILVINGVNFSFYWFQFVYYLFALLVLLLGLGFIVSSLQVFVKDTLQLVKVILRFGFWFTPIIWNMEKIPEQFQFYMKLNPMYYIVNGYRKSFLYGEGFWEDLDGMLIYWSFTLVVLILGVIIFKRLRPHFSDVL